MRPNDFGRRDFGRDAVWNALQDNIYAQDGIDIADDPRLNELFDNLLPRYRGEYPSGSVEAVNEYHYDAFRELQEYIWDSEEYSDWDLGEFYDWQDWRDWRANYDAAG